MPCKQSGTSWQELPNIKHILTKRPRHPSSELYGRTHGSGGCFHNGFLCNGTVANDSTAADGITVLRNPLPKYSHTFHQFAPLFPVKRVCRNHVQAVQPLHNRPRRMTLLHLAQDPNFFSFLKARKNPCTCVENPMNRTHYCREIALPRILPSCSPSPFSPCSFSPSRSPRPPSQPAAP